jgi:23S rRNA pseudouridine1911/1915/1917 synthase
VERLVLGTPAAAAGLRLDRFLADAPGVGTRSQAKRLIDEGRVWVDGRCGKAAQRLRAEARVEVALAARPTPSLTPEPVPLAILYEDDDLVAIDKPAGMVVHPAPGRPGGTLVNALVHRWGRAPQVGHPSRPGIVHRLDRDTSGVLLVARTPAVLEGLARQFRERAVEKHYLALVHGLLRAPTGTIDRPIGRHPRARQRMSVRSRRGRAALTRWTVLERLPGATLVRLEPETGRTHQLRVHLAALGYPIVGDPVYGGRRGRRSASPLGDFPRQALHAEQIGFVHPGTGVRLTVRAPLPPDLEALLAALRQAAATKGKSRGAT